MLRDKPLTHLILILFVSVLFANIIGEALRIVLYFLVGSGSLPERALLDYVHYNIGPHMFDARIFSFSFGFTLNLNVISLLGIFVGWYYYRYSY